jgi:hypothetical protein
MKLKLVFENIGEMNKKSERIEGCTERERQEG